MKNSFDSHRIPHLIYTYAINTDIFATEPSSVFTGVRGKQNANIYKLFVLFIKN